MSQFFFSHFRNINNTVLVLLCVLVTSGLYSQNALDAKKVYKVEIKKSGLYRFDYNYLKAILGNDSYKNLHFYSSYGFQLFEEIEDPLQSYLQELPYYSEDLKDGSLDQGDNLLVYVQGPEDTHFDKTENQWTHRNTIYDDANYLFITIAEEEYGLKIDEYANDDSAIEISKGEIINHYETDVVNILKESFNNREYGSGQEWYEKSQLVNRSLGFDSRFNFDNYDISSPLKLSLALAGRANSTIRANLSVSGKIEDFSLSPVNVNNNLSTYARRAEKEFFFSLTSPPKSIELSTTCGDSNGKIWIDWIECRYLSTIDTKSDDLYYIQADETGKIKSNSDISDEVLWDVTNPFRPRISTKTMEHFYLNELTQPKKIFFGSEESALDPGEPVMIPTQNINAYKDIDYFILYHKSFEAAAQNLISHRKSLDPNLRAQAIEVTKIYNEYGSGKADPSAIRNFLSHHYNRDHELESVLLMGDGTFDCRYLYDGIPKENFIPVYQTKTSLNPISSYPSDDYYALLDVGEGATLKGALDIAVGRLPVKNSSEAIGLVNKIIQYESVLEENSQWTSKVAFVADDEDNNLHLNSAERISDFFAEKHPEYSSTKIYTDAYPQEYTTSGEKNPLSTEAIYKAIDDGVLAMCYMGHGGSEGWADEQILQKTDISTWDNITTLPLLITATCSFAGYDKPSNLSAGEMVLLKKDGGCAALMTTVRVVTAQDNERLTKAVFDHLLTIENDRVIPIGEVLIRAKNSNRSDTLQSNARKFTLLGDPMMRLKSPTRSVHIENISTNGNENTDSLRALDFVSINGAILTSMGTVDDRFKGTLELSVVDKPTQLKTLGQDAGSREQEFLVQNRVLFQGRSEVQNGKFTIEFFLPKDINYSLGQGKIVMTAQSSNHLAIGSKSDVIIGGSNPDAPKDNEGPEIQITLKNPLGSDNLSNANPIFGIFLRDDSGINVSSSAIGHDITATLDSNTKNKQVLNNKFIPTKNSYTEGSIEFELADLASGSHTLSITAWDSYNNVSTSTIDFSVGDVVSSDTFTPEAYPNPFSNLLSVRFENPFRNEPYSYNAFIYDMTGRMLYSFTGENQNGTGFTDINLLDENPQLKTILGNGIYQLKILVNSDQEDQSNIIKTGVVTISRFIK